MKKRKIFMAAMLLATVSMTIVSCKDNDKDKPQDPTTEQDGDNLTLGRDKGYVDLGLSVKWAVCNIGAKNAEDYGCYFAWGETATKETYANGNYKWATAKYNAEFKEWSIESLTKYCTNSDEGTVDNKTMLDLEDDAARANWGGSWRMPTAEEWAELCNPDNCTWKPIKDDGNEKIKGFKVTSKINGNSIFLPAANYRTEFDDEDFEDEKCCFYWSSSLAFEYSDIHSYSLNCLSYYDESEVIDMQIVPIGRPLGLSVRPVLATEDNSGTIQVGGQPDPLLGKDKGYVDLGLPSGLKWAVCNVGARDAESYGCYFAWGETSARFCYYMNYKWFNYDSADDWSIIKYNDEDNKTVLDLEDDAAHANWGGSWRMPTAEEWEELLDEKNCTCEAVTGGLDAYGDEWVKGYKVTSKTNGNSIFLPAAGRGYYLWPISSGYCHYWSSSLYMESFYDAYSFIVCDEICGMNNHDRDYGLSVRAVCK
ncbi:MAG: hypothetical protein ACI30B_08105 [Paludibacteraceae bacterium]